MFRVFYWLYEFIYWNFFPFVVFYWAICFAIFTDSDPRGGHERNKMMWGVAFFSSIFGYIYNYLPVPYWNQHFDIYPYASFSYIYTTKGLYPGPMYTVYSTRFGYELFEFFPSTIFPIILMLVALYVIHRMQVAHGETLYNLIVRRDIDAATVTLTLTALIMLTTQTNLFYFIFWVEIFGVCAVTLVGTSDKKTTSAELSLKLLILNIVGSSFLLLGVVIFYLTTGSLELEAVSKYCLTNGFLVQSVAAIASFCLLIGFVFKLGLVPFHFLIPDLYGSASPTFLVLYGGIFKIVILIFFSKILIFFAGFFGVVWYVVFTILGLITMILGTMGAVANRHNIRRMFGYIAVISAGNTGVLIADFSLYSFQQILIYVVADFLAMLVIFMLWLEIDELEIDNSSSIPASKFLTESDFLRFAETNLFYLMSYALVLFALSGIPIFGIGLIKLFLVGGAFAGASFSNVVPLILLLINNFSGLCYLFIWGKIFLNNTSNDDDDNKGGFLGGRGYRISLFNGRPRVIASVLVTTFMSLFAGYCMVAVQLIRFIL